MTLIMQMNTMETYHISIIGLKHVKSGYWHQMLVILSKELIFMLPTIVK